MVASSADGGFSFVNNINNPATDNTNCPPGYLPQPISSHTAFAYQPFSTFAKVPPAVYQSATLYVCVPSATSSIVPNLNYGGMYSAVNSACSGPSSTTPDAYGNPFNSGAQSCPSGYASNAVATNMTANGYNSQSGDRCSMTLYLCTNPTVTSLTVLSTQVAGGYQPGGNKSVNNPFTKTVSCPPGFTAQQLAIANNAIDSTTQILVCLAL